jgi:hypothetical protein
MKKNSMSLTNLTVSSLVASSPLILLNQNAIMIFIAQDQLIKLSVQSQISQALTNTLNLLQQLHKQTLSLTQPTTLNLLI